MADTIQQQPLIPIDANDAYQQYMQQQQAMPMQPQQQLVPMAANADTAQPAPSVDTIQQLNMDAANSAAAWNTSKRMSSAQENMDKVVKSTQGVMPHLLAVGAALKGNFGPAIALQQQKEQTAIGKAMIPVLANINDLRIQGRFDEAYAAAEQAAAQAGDRAPEVSRLLQGTSSAIAKTKEQMQMTQYAAETLMDRITLDAERKGTKPQDDIRYNQAKAMLKAAKRGSYFDQAFINNEMVAARVHNQNVAGKNIQTTEGGTAISETPSQQVAEPSQTSGYVADQIGKKWGIQPHDVANIQNNKPIVINGELVKVHPDLRNEILDDIAKLQGERSEIDVGKQLPVTPGYVELGRQQGIGNIPLAMGAAGMTPQQLQNTYKGNIQREQDIREAEILAKFKVPIASSGLPYTIVDKTNGQEKPNLSGNYAIAHQDKYSLLDPQKVVLSQNFFKVTSRLNALKEIADSLPDANAPMSRVAGVVNRTLNRRLGLDPNFTYAQTVQAVLHRDVENYFNSRGTASQEFGDLASALTGPNATKQGFLEAHKGLSRLLQEDHQLLLNQGNDDNIPESLKQKKEAPVVAPQSQAPSTTPQGTPLYTPGAIKGTLR